MTRRQGKHNIRRSDMEADEIVSLNARIEEGAPSKIGEPQSSTENESSYADAKKFIDLPISEHTKQGLKDSKFVNLTAIQKSALPHALCGRDILGAAKTGSGKTLAFLIPVIELLYRLRWGPLDGLGGLIISPTRELALQIFNELRKVGKHHDLSAGLLIGGKNVKEEKERIGGLNILICTPGRLLQHMDETPNFDPSQVQILVLDEADRILDMGFSAAINAIVENLPVERQTLLFSATQKQSVKQLVRLSLKDPQYVSVHENAETPTPVKLEQAYAIVELQDKLNVLWSFIRSHIKAKILVFASTCKQVKFLFEAFSRLRPGCPLRSLHGGMKQMKRMAVFYDFSEASSGMTLFATDIAARGLDFAKLDWVIQMDCPEDVPSYIHRVGRTARYVSAGRGLLMLTPNETDFLRQLEEGKVPIKGIKINPNKTQPITPALQSLLSKNQELKESAQRSVTSYLKSVFLSPNKAVFDVNKLPIVEFALSLGLSAPPKLRFIEKAHKRAKQSQIASEKNLGQISHASEGPKNLENGGNMNEQNPSQIQDTNDEDFEPKQNPLEDIQGPDNLSPGEFLQLKNKAALDAKSADLESSGKRKENPSEIEEFGKGKKKKKMKIRVGDVSSNRILFDQEGRALNPLEALAEENERDENEEGIRITASERFAKAAAALKLRDLEDKKSYQERKRQKAQEKKAKIRLREGQENELTVSLGPGLGIPGDENSGESEDAGNVDAQSFDSESDGQLDLETSQNRSLKSKSHAKVEKAHLDMGLKRGKNLDNLSLKEKEALALKLLTSRT